VRFESSDSAVALVGMDGFRLLAGMEVDGGCTNWWRRRPPSSAAQAAVPGPLTKGSSPSAGAGPAHRRAPGGGRVEQAHLALPGASFRGRELDGEERRDRPSGVDDAPGPG
jgi:hypothetical protein